jgi:trehalose 2-sulfotransferase
MSASDLVDKPQRRVRPLRSVRRLARRWVRLFGVRFSLLPRLADRGYMICTTPRSGSNYLCQLLASTGQLGNPIEYFNTRSRRKHTDPKYPKDRRGQLDIVRSMGATPNGIYAVKVMPLQYSRATKEVDIFRELPNLQLVRLRRRDLLGQAISVARVQQTGQFRASNQVSGKPVYDAQDIRNCLHAVRARESMWDQLMFEFGMQPLTLEYEDVMRDPQAAVDQVSALVGLAASPPIDFARVLVTVQRDRETDAWRQQFLADTGDEFRHLES